MQLTMLANEVNNFLEKEYKKSKRNEYQILSTVLGGIHDEMTNKEIIAKIYLLNAIQMKNEAKIRFFRKNNKQNEIIKKEIDSYVNLLSPNDKEEHIDSIENIQDFKNFNPNSGTLPLIEKAKEQLLDTLRKRSKKRIEYLPEFFNEATSLQEYINFTNQTKYHDGELTKDFDRGHMEIVDHTKNTKIDDVYLKNKYQEDEKYRNFINMKDDYLSFYNAKHGNKHNIQEEISQKNWGNKSVRTEAIWQTLLDFTDQDKEKADVLNRFCQQMILGSLMVECGNDLQFNIPKNSKDSTFRFSIVQSNQTTLSKENGEIYIDANIKFNTVMEDSSAGEFWQRALLKDSSFGTFPIGHETNQPHPLICEIVARVKMIENPNYSSNNSNEQNRYCLQFEKYDIVLHTPLIEPIDALKNNPSRVKIKPEVDDLESLQLSSPKQMTK